jgi:hypothetical protein
MKSSAEIERAIIGRLHEAYLDGRAFEILGEFFEHEGDKSEIPLLRGSEKRKIRVTNVTRNDREARREGVACYGNYTESELSPITNRGVTFNQKTENSREITKNCPRIMGGYDGGVEVGFAGKWHKLKFQDLLLQLEKAKLAAQQPGNPERIIEYKNQLYEVKPKSAPGQTTYKYVVEGNGVRFYVHSNPSGDIQPIRIRYNAEGLIGRDLFLKHNETLEFLKELGFEVVTEKLSRVDMQVMLYKDITEFIELIQAGKYVCSAQTYSFNGKGKSIDTFTMGQQLQICIYDKRKELFAHVQSEPCKFALMVYCCFGNEWMEREIPVTRVEFRIRREILKVMGINTLDDLLIHESGLSRYCTHTWFRLLSGQKIKGHTGNQPIHKLWKEVQEQFVKYFPGADGNREEVSRVNRTKTISCSSDALEKQAIGCLKTAAALRLGSEGALTETEKYVMGVVADKVQQIAQGALDRAIEYEIRNGEINSNDYNRACKLRGREEVMKEYFNE